jgi:predicted PurR-regulated permease PerM
MKNHPFSTPRVSAVLARVGVWALLFGFLFVMRGFFLLLFLTFIFAYLQANAVEKIKHLIPTRWVRVTTVGIGFLTLLVGLGFFIVPQVKTQAATFVSQYPKYLQGFDNELRAIANNYPVLREALPDLNPPTGEQVWTVDHSPSAALLRQLFGLGQSETGAENLKATVDAIRDVGARALAVGSAFLLSLLFSFLIVLDLPKLTESLLRLEHTKVQFIYREVAGGIHGFSQMLGRWFQAQFFIALLNTALTGIGILLLGLGHSIAFLCTIVFLCSFIPVAGVFLSSVPICLLALEAGGVTLALFAIGLILLIHAIEAYILNPRIFGAHLKVNPVIVLIILTVGGKLFHVWGLVLGLPVCSYIFGHAIRYPETKSLDSKDPL